MKIRSPLLTKLAARLMVAAIRLLFRTCRIRVLVDRPDLNCYEPPRGNRYLYCVWHDQIVMTCFSGRPKQMAGLVSRHQDGSYLANAMQLLGIQPVRGSSKRGGDRAMRELIDRARDYHVAITPDGPRGPRRVVKPGIVFLAAHSGRGIIPAAYACRKSFHIRGNWTDMMLPMPFTTVYVRGGTPLTVPEGLSRSQLDEYVARLQAAMDRLEREALTLAGCDVGTKVQQAERPRRAA